MVEEKNRADARLKRARAAYELHIARHGCEDAASATCD